MAIDNVTGKRIRVSKVKGLKEIEEERKKKALPKFDKTYEEELIQQLFKDDIKQETESLNTLSLEERNTVHQKRPGQE